MESLATSVADTQAVTLPPLNNKKTKKTTSTKPKATGTPKVPSVSPSPTSKKESRQPQKDVTGVHPAMIGVDVQSLYPHHSELIDKLYKRPLVVSILIPRKRPKQFKYESSKHPPMDIFSSEEELSDGLSSKRPRSPDRPTSRQGTAGSSKSKKALKIFILKVYDLVESKEAVYPVVIRDYEKLLEELIEEFKSFAVCDYFKPQSLDWWAKSLRTVVIVFDKPSGELCTVVDKKLIRRLVAQQMEHHEWLDKALTPDQVHIQQKMMIDKARKKSSKSAKSAKLSLRGSADFSSSEDLLPWNDYTKMGERNEGSFRGATASSKTASTASAKSSSASSPVRPLPPVRSAKEAPPKLHYVGDWVEGNFKRAGQWFPGIIRKVHKNHEYYDIDYDDGRSETNVEARLVRASRSSPKSWKSREGSDVIDFLHDENGAAQGEMEALPGDPSTYDYGDAFSPDTTGILGDPFDESTWDASALADPAEQSYESTDAEQYGESTYDNSADYDASQYGESQYGGGDPVAVGGETETTEGGVSHQAYDYTHRAVIAEDDAVAEAGVRVAGELQEGEVGEENSLVEEVADSAELMAMENSGVERKVATPYVEEIIYNVVSSKYPARAAHSQIREEGDAVAAENSSVERKVATPYVEEIIHGVLATSYPAATAVEHFPEPPEEEETGEGSVRQVEGDERVPAANDADAPTDVGETHNGGVNEADMTFIIAVDGEVFSPSADYYPSDALQESNAEDSDYILHEDGSTAFQSTPSKMALASMLQALELEESSVESGGVSKKVVAKKKRKGTGPRKGASAKLRGGGGLTASSVVLGNSESEAESAYSGPRSASQKKKAQTNTKSAVAIAVPDGLFKAPAGRAKTASGVQPPDVDRYVAAAAAVVRPDKTRAATAAKGKRGGTSQKKKKPKPTAAQATSAALVLAGHHPTAEELLKGVPGLEEDEQSVHSMHSLQSLHSSQAHMPHIHFTADAHGHFHHNDVPHYPLPHQTRLEATKAALEAIHKPHSNPHDRYTYTMMPMPVHLRQPQHHNWGHGPLKDEHGNYVSDSHHHNHQHSGSGSGNVSRTASHDVDPHGPPFARALSPDTLQEHNAHGHHQHGHHHGKLHFPHHEHDFYISAAPIQHPHHHEPSIFSETVRSSTGNHTPNPHYGTSHGHAHGHSGHGEVHSPGTPLHTKSRSRSTTPIRSRSPAPPRNLPAAADASVAGTAEAGMQMSQSLISFDSLAGSKPSTAKRSGSRGRTPFAHKERYKGPARRVIDIIEWARWSVGGSPKKQNRKMSEVEKRLLHSPLAKKLIVDAPVDVEVLMKELNYTH